MSKIRSKNTKPERLVRSYLHKAGYRFRLHRKDLPGSPDIVMPKYKLAIFVHGCFWHYHDDCRDGKIPQDNHEKWKIKLETNVARDKRNIDKLTHLGWNTLVIWECEIKKDLSSIKNKILTVINQ